ncbi:glyoxalase/bleomycin resistance/dioxygenase family protein [Streptomyces sp. NPDC058401]|uniref:glyoxalase/bleomycin resistance/dioxygenase family protein n=1 Tax=Streptomyces sp. NPDC058401 TaxID=3346480 RepID=UPI00365332D9
MDSTTRLSLLVLYTPRVEDCRRFYADLGLAFTAERHGRGPEHYAAVLPDGTVLELYPATGECLSGALRLGLAVDGAAVRPPLAPGRHRLVDPDGRTVEITAVEITAVEAPAVEVPAAGWTEGGSAQG